MGDNKKAEVDSETILMTLDQIGQTIDIMTNVVGRLRGYITEQAEVATKEANPGLQIDDSELPASYREHSRTVH